MFENFFNKQQQPQQQPQNANPQQQQQQSANPSQQQANPNQGTNNPEQMQDPLQAYKDLWANPTSSVNGEAPQFKLDPNTVNQVSSKIDFTSELPEDLQQRMQSGEQPSWEDIVAVANHVGRRTYSTAMEHQSALTGTFVDLHGKHSQKNLPSLIKQHMTQNKVGSLPAAQSNPIVRAQLEKVSQQLSTQYPDASEEWIADQTKQYFVEMARQLSPDAFVPTGEDAIQRTNAKKFDWDAWMTQEQSPRLSQ